MNSLLHGDSLVIHEVAGGQTEHLADLVSMMQALFPQYSHNLSRVRDRAKQPVDYDPRCIVHQWLAEVEGQPAGLITFKYVRAQNLGLLIYLAVNPEFRMPWNDIPCRLSEILLISARDQLLTDAQRLGHSGPVHLAAEVEYPELVERYRHYGFVEFPVEYYEPPVVFDPGTYRADAEGRLDPYRPMYLGIFPAVGCHVDAWDADLLYEALYAFYVNHYGLPEDHWALTRALAAFKPAVSKGA